MMNEQRPNLPALTGIRACAAGAVVLSHWQGWRPDDLPAPLSWVAVNGYLGVDLFFLLSGLVLGLSNVNAAGQLTRPVGGYLRARVARIYPVYALCWLLAALPYHWNLPPDGAAGAGLSSLLLVQNWLPATLGWAWNLPAWSLSVEACCYLALPFLALLIARIPARLHLTALFGLWAWTLLAPRVAAAQPPGSYWHHTSTSLPLWFIGEFAAGLLLARMWRNRTSDRAAILAPLAAIALVAVALLGARLPLEVARHGLVDPLLASLLYGVACGSLRWLGSPWLVLAGEASYALYLLHWPLWDWLTHYQSLPAGLPGLALYTAVLAVMALAVHLGVERPARAWLLRARPVGATSAPSHSAPPIPVA